MKNLGDSNGYHYYNGTEITNGLGLSGLQGSNLKSSLEVLGSYTKDI